MRGRRVLEGSKGGKIPEETLVLKDSQVSLLALSFNFFKIFYHYFDLYKFLTKGIIRNYLTTLPTELQRH